MQCVAFALLKMTVGKQGCRIKIEVILNGASGWALVVGRRAVKNPVE